MELATASRVPSGEYAISLMLPLPRHRVAPSGNPHRWCFWAVVDVSASVVVNSRVKVKSVNVFMSVSPFVNVRGGNPRRFVIAGPSRYGNQPIGAVANRAYPVHLDRDVAPISESPFSASQRNRRFAVWGSGDPNLQK